MIPRDRNLDHLSEEFRPLAFEILARLTEAGIAVILTETRRSAAAHAEDLATGHSWNKVSKHQLGNAIDVCLYDYYDAHGPDKALWNAGDPLWAQVGLVGKRVAGVGWGGDWKHVPPDVGHFELAKSSAPKGE